jgi:phosphoglycolate phosphatase-like HAD superfamily hydrolase
VDQGSGLRADPDLGRRGRPARGGAGDAATAHRPLTIFFDFDGTLVDVRQRHYRAYRLALAPLGGRPLDPSAYWRLKRRGGSHGELLSRSGVAEDRQGVFLDGFLAQVEDPANLRLDRLFPGVADMLWTLRRGGDRLYLVSLRRAAGPFLQQVEELGIAGAFARVCSGRPQVSGEGSKAQLIGQLGFEQPAAAVGDTEADILAARALGLTAVGVPTGLRSRGCLRRAGADVVLDRVRQLPELRQAIGGPPPRR